jgi:hypothetical protein
MRVSQKIAQKRNSLLFRIKLKVHSKIMAQWEKWIKVLLIVLLVEIIIVNALVINYFLRQTTTISIAQAQVQDMGKLVEADLYLEPETTDVKSILSEDTPSETSSVESLIRKTFPEDAETMLVIAKWESNMRPDAVNTSNRNESIDCGLLQINSIHGYDCEWLKDPVNNLKVARKIYDTQGLQAWSSYNNAIINNIPIK